MPVEIRQIVLSELDRVDRCTSCHLAVEDPSYAGLRLPLAYHPNHDRHPFEKFGCTICHQGQGRATTREAAHGHVEHWDRPMLDDEIHPVRLRQMPFARPTCPAPRNWLRGHVVFEETGCIGCHKLHGVGGMHRA